MNKDYHFDFKDRQLENGLRLISVRTSSPIFSMQIGIKVGSMYESEDEKGLSHFIEHMLFKGTKNRKNEEINADIEEIGGNYTAYTTYSDTVYGITGLSEEFESSLDIVSDLIINPIFPESEFEKEKSVIVSEIRRGLDDLEHYSFMKLYERAFEKSFLKWDIAGTEKNIRAYSMDKLRDFYSRFYVPDNSIITVVSPYAHDQVENKVNDYFKSWTGGKREDIEVITEDNIAGEKSTYKKEIEQSTLSYLYTFYNLSRREEIALEILSYRLGESPNSLLFKMLREEKGLTYDVYSDINENDNIKTMTIYTSLDDDNLEEARVEIEGVISSLKSGAYLEQKNIDIMKKVIRTAIASTLIDPDSLTSYILGQAVENKDIREFEEHLEILNDIELEEIIEVANKVLDSPTIQIVKPV